MQNEDKSVDLNLAKVKKKIVVLSGKGGVGKSTVAVNLAAMLADDGAKTGILDVDIHGPSVPKMLGLEGMKLGAAEDNRIKPVAYNQNLSAISVGFAIDSVEEALIWRGPMKYSVIKQFLSEVEWGELDYLVVDSPPGTGDEVLAACQLLPDVDGAVIVTTPQDVALSDVAKSITFCKKLNLPILGVVENMSGFSCPHCGKMSHIFKKDGGKKIAEEMNVPFLGEIPINPGVAHHADEGKLFSTSLESENEATAYMRDIKNRVLEQL